MNAKDVETITSAVLAALDARAAAQAPTVVAQAKQVVSPYIDAPVGERQRATRVFNAQHKVAGKYCPSCKVGFVFVKTTCPRCAATL